MYINVEKKFVFVEFCSVEEVLNVFVLDGIVLDGVSVRIRRSNDYNSSFVYDLGLLMFNLVLNFVVIGLDFLVL